MTNTRQSKIRLDPVQGLLTLRGYAVAGDPAVPLAEEMRAHSMVGTITIAGRIAVGTGLNGDLSDKDLWRDLDEALRERGVTELHWERHKNGKVLPKIRRIGTG